MNYCMFYYFNKIKMKVWCLHCLFLHFSERKVMVRTPKYSHMSSRSPQNILTISLEYCKEFWLSLWERFLCRCISYCYFSYTNCNLLCACVFFFLLSLLNKNMINLIIFSLVRIGMGYGLYYTSLCRNKNYIHLM